MTESNTRALIFFGCISAGLFLMIPAAWIGHTVLESVELSPWLESLLGFIIALTPTALLTRFAARKLDRRYPDSIPGRIPEPHERPSAHRL
jgi:hypothetical protein